MEPVRLVREERREVNEVGVERVATGDGTGILRARGGDDFPPLLAFVHHEVEFRIDAEEFASGTLGDARIPRGALGKGAEPAGAVVADAPRHSLAVEHLGNAETPHAVLALQHGPKLHLHAAVMNAVDGVLEVEIALRMGEVLVLERGAPAILPDDGNDCDPVCAGGGDGIDFTRGGPGTEIARGGVETESDAPLEPLGDLFPA